MENGHAIQGPETIFFGGGRVLKGCRWKGMYYKVI